MKNFKHFAAIMAIIAMSLTGCQKEILKGGNGNDPAGAGKAAKMGL